MFEIKKKTNLTEITNYFLSFICWLPSLFLLRELLVDFLAGLLDIVTGKSTSFDQVLEKKRIIPKTYEV